MQYFVKNAVFYNKKIDKVEMHSHFALCHTYFANYENLVFSENLSLAQKKTNFWMILLWLVATVRIMKFFVFHKKILRF